MNNGKLNPFIDFINMLCNFFVLNLVFLITCLPIFTIGSALSSLYYVMGKESKGEYGYLVRTYIREFKRNFKSGTIAFLILFIIGGLLLFNLLFWPFRRNALSAGVTGILIILSIIWLIISHYTYPLIGRFINTPVNSIKNAWGLSLRNLKWTFALLIVDILTASFCLFLPLEIVLISLFSLGFVLIAFFQSFLFNRVFSPYEKTDESTGTRQSILRNHADMMTDTSQF